MTHPYSIALNRSYTFSFSDNTEISGKYLGTNDVEYWVIKTTNGQLTMVNPDLISKITGGTK